MWTKTPFKTNDYFTMIGDYVVTTKLSKRSAQQIASAYETVASEAEMEERVSKILNQRHKSKIKIERNATKAQLLRKKLFKNFYLPKAVQEKYHLFV